MKPQDVLNIIKNLVSQQPVLPAAGRGVACTIGMLLIFLVECCAWNKFLFFSFSLTLCSGVCALERTTSSPNLEGVLSWRRRTSSFNSALVLGCFPNLSQTAVSEISRNVRHRLNGKAPPALNRTAFVTPPTETRKPELEGAGRANLPMAPSRWGPGETRHVGSMTASLPSGFPQTAGQHGRWSSPQAHLRPHPLTSIQPG